MGSDGARVVMESYLLGLVSMETFLQTMSDMELIAIDSAREELERIKKDTFKPTPKTPEDTTGAPIGGADKRTLGAASGKKPTKDTQKKRDDKVKKDSKGKNSAS